MSDLNTAGCYSDGPFVGVPIGIRPLLSRVSQITRSRQFHNPLYHIPGANHFLNKRGPGRVQGFGIWRGFRVQGGFRGSGLKEAQGFRI